ncbi:MAG: 2-amino-4-hydroxy-6-hydroxymethyldihydropteridine diphosphokinase [Actinomycetota bacterium]|nr:2-amino-4-hydroxy-6-hydroxymethyldihydropteridine diphosphokinase [Actinomycetota bacterium]
MTRFAIAVGSNLGDRIQHLRFARSQMGGLGDVHAVSGLYETAPVGGPDQDPYLNAVFVLDSALQPSELLESLHAVEAEAGRERKTKWGPRTLDLDIVSMDPGEIATEHLVVPHPRAAEREFVLRPLCDVWPSATVGEDLEARRALDRLTEDQGVDLLAASWLEEHPWPGRLFVGAQFAWFLVVALLMAWDGTVPEGDADPVRVAGALVAFVGAGLAFISSRRLGPALTALPEPRDEGSLIETGAYSRARHPIYGGVTMFILGASLIVDSLAGSLLSLGLIPFFFVKSSYEERRLRIKYPGYRAYQHRVTHRIIPFLI